MNTTLNNLVALSTFVQQHQNDALPIKTAYKFNKMAYAIEKDIQFFQSQYKIILDNYAEKDEMGNPILNGQEIKVKEGEIQNYLSKMEELLSTEVEINFPLFTLDELSNYELSIAELRPLMPFIKE